MTDRFRPAERRQHLGDVKQRSYRAPGVGP